MLFRESDSKRKREVSPLSPLLNCPPQEDSDISAKEPSFTVLIPVNHLKEKKDGKHLKKTTPF